MMKCIELGLHCFIINTVVNIKCFFFLPLLQKPAEADSVRRHIYPSAGGSVGQLEPASDPPRGQKDQRVRKPESFVCVKGVGLFLFHKM